MPLCVQTKPLTFPPCRTVFLTLWGLHRRCERSSPLCILARLLRRISPRSSGCLAPSETFDPPPSSFYSPTITFHLEAVSQYCQKQWKSFFIKTAKSLFVPGSPPSRVEGLCPGII